MTMATCTFLFVPYKEKTEDRMRNGSVLGLNNFLIPPRPRPLCLFYKMYHEKCTSGPSHYQSIRVSEGKHLSFIAYVSSHSRDWRECTLFQEIRRWPLVAAAWLFSRSHERRLYCAESRFKVSSGDDLQVSPILRVQPSFATSFRNVIKAKPLLFWQSSAGNKVFIEAA